MSCEKIELKEKFKDVSGDYDKKIDDLESMMNEFNIKLQNEISMKLEDEESLIKSPVKFWQNILIEEDQINSIEDEEERNRMFLKRACILFKFLVAREFNVDKAVSQLVGALEWRYEEKISGILEETFGEHFDCLGYLYKTDKDGPCCYNVYGNIDSKKCFPNGLDDFIRWRIQLMEKTIELIDFTNIKHSYSTQIHDYDNVGLLSFDANAKAASKTLIKIFQNYYPETLSRKYFINVPYFFKTVYNLICLWLDEKTKQKFIVCSQGNYREDLLVNIPLDNIPPQYGGFKDDNKKIDQIEIKELNEYTIKSGKTEYINLDIDEESNSTNIYFKLLALSKDISFSIEYYSGDEGEGKKIVYSENKIDQLSDSLLQVNPGRYTFCLDNSYSYFNSKKVKFGYITINDENISDETENDNNNNNYNNE